MESKIREYTNDAITVQYDVKRCIHAAECVRRLPDVFDPNKRPWINLTSVNTDQLAAVIERCPTGALHYVRHDGGAAEQTPAENTITLERDGPLYVKGSVEVTDPAGHPLLRDTRVALCRCGASVNKPLCDGSHHRIAFEAE